MMAIALGRLGVREFDLASDADLNFVIPDNDAPETLFWTNVAERLISVIGAYTGDGVVFTIDTRLRPNGREGALVQTEGTYRKYFAQSAQAWEGISYMKARAIAGDTERGTAFLGELQKIDWERYGQGRRSRERARAHAEEACEREQGVRNPLKAGSGGYYDIDFVLMYLRLRDAGNFHKALNTPKRIEVIVASGNLNPDDAAFLEDAATIFRAIDHGLRVATGYAEGTLPRNPAHVAVLTEARTSLGTARDAAGHSRNRDPADSARHPRFLRTDIPQRSSFPRRPDALSMPERVRSKDPTRSTKMGFRMVRDGIFFTHLGFTAAGALISWLLGPVFALPLFILGATFCAWFFSGSRTPDSDWAGCRIAGGWQSGRNRERRRWPHPHQYLSEHFSMSM